MEEDNKFLLFQFEVDNIATVERGVALLLSRLPTHPSWVLTYLRLSPQSTVAREFLYTFVRQATAKDVPLLRNVLAAAAIPFSLRLLLASPAAEIAAVLIEWYQQPWPFFAQDG